MPKEAGLDTRGRILESVVSWAATTGARKLSMDEIARGARIGRATLYKYFPGRDALVSALVEQELAKFFAAVQSAVDQYSDPEDRLVFGFANAYRLLRDHPAVEPVLRLNPEMLLPYVITKNSVALDWGRIFVEQMAAGELPEADLRRFGEHFARAYHTLILIPSTVLGVDDDPDGAEQYARDFLVPVYRHLAAKAVESSRVTAD